MVNPNEITDGITTGVEVRQQRGLEIAGLGTLMLVTPATDAGP